jgi:hypothetical protein
MGDTGMHMHGGVFFLSSHCVENCALSLELFVINYYSKKHMQENKSPNCDIFFTSKNHLFQKKFI